MNKTLKAVTLLWVIFLTFSSAQAASDANSEPVKNTSSGTGTKIKDVVKHDAKATGRAVKHAAKATARVVKQGAKAVVNGVKRGTKAVTKSIKHEDHSTGNATNQQSY